MIEDLGIKLEVSEQSIRESIDEDRIALGLEPLLPHEEHGPGDWLMKYPKTENDGPVCHVIEAPVIAPII